jgi:predicted AlkP superfamily pyrophosphatase or phosphodiesterase
MALIYAEARAPFVQRARVRWAGGLIAVLLAACGGGSPTAPASPPPVVRHTAVIVSIDGMRADAAQAAAPNLVALSQRGAFSWRAQTVVPSITLSGHASMLSGDTPNVHGMTWAEWDPRETTITVPTIFTIARAAGLDTAMVVGKPKLAHLNAPGSTDVFVICGSDDDVATRAVAEVNAERDLLFVHLPDTDLTGHRYGWMSAQYMAALSRADLALGRIIAAARPSTTFVVTADHGGHGRDHNASTPVDMTIPWVIAGPGVKAGLALTMPVRVFDTAPTVAAVMGLDVPTAMEGRPVLEALLPRPSP